MSGSPAFVIPGRPIVIPGHPLVLPGDPLVLPGDSLVIPGLVPGTNPSTGAANGPRHKAGDDGMAITGGRTTADILRGPPEPPPRHPAQAA